MRTNVKKLTKGFTIIEVLIVLAIAGLILAIVFLAVPALQRNARNQAIKSDAAGVIAGVNDSIANNNGTLPTGISVSGSTVTITNGTNSEAKVRGGTQVTWTNQAAAPCPAIVGTTGTVQVMGNCKWNTTTSPVSFTYAPRSIAAGFQIENKSSTTAAHFI